MKPPFLLIGQQPNQATELHPDLWLLPDDSGMQHTANRLLAHTGWSLDTYLAIFNRTNLVGHCGDWLLGEARRKAGELVERDSLEYAGFVVLGRRTASAFEWETIGEVPVKTPAFLYWQSVVSPGIPYRVPAVVVPHSSLLNHWWNDEKNRALARCFFDELPRHVGRTPA